MLPSVQPKSFKEAFSTKYLEKGNDENIVVAEKNVELVGMQKTQEKIAQTQRCLYNINEL